MSGNVNENLDRCGYEVSPKLLKIWEVELEMLQELLTVCKEHDIKIFAFSGTLLGAVRHKGFIPWDDDLDMAMLREDYEKLISLEKSFRYPFFLQHIGNDDRFFFDYARLRNSETTGIITWNQSPDYNNGIYIDIYVLDGITQNKKQLEKQVFVRSILRNIIRAKKYEHIADCTSWRKRIVFCLAHLVGGIHSTEEWFEIYNKNLSQYTNESNPVGLMTHSMEVLRRYSCSRMNLTEIVYVPFENIKIPIPKSYDIILKNIYGDYMSFPPAEERGAWHENQIIFDPDTPYKEYFEKHKKDM